MEEGVMSDVVFSMSAKDARSLACAARAYGLGDMPEWIEGVVDTHEADERRKALGLPWEESTPAVGVHAIHFTGFDVGSCVFPNGATCTLALSAPKLAEHVEKLLRLLDVQFGVKPGNGAHGSATTSNAQAALKESGWL
jgi:hypothetical protein